MPRQLGAHVRQTQRFTADRSVIRHIVYLHTMPQALFADVQFSGISLTLDPR